MLTTLRRIVQKVSDAQGLNEALEIIVQMVQEVLSIDVCSVYLAEHTTEGSQWVLRATRGLSADAVNNARLEWNEGLVGLVAERAEPVNIQSAAQHPRYHYLPLTAEESFDVFLGVPIIHRGRVLGVLVVQQQQNCIFSEETVAFLLTLAAQLSVHILQAIIGDTIKLKDGRKKVSPIVEGLAGSPGIGIGEAVVVYSTLVLEGVPDRPVQDVEVEIERFEAACDTVAKRISALRAEMVDKLPPDELALFDAYYMMLESPATWEPVIGGIRAGNWAPGALREAIAEYSRVFAAMDDSYLRERASDVRDLGQRILMQLEEREQTPKQFPKQTIIVGDEVSAAQLAEVPQECLAGMVSSSGSGSSHVAILARALGIPTVMGATDLPVGRMQGRRLIIDGYQGRVFVDPERHVLAEFLRLVREERELADGLEELIDQPAVTPDGMAIALYANTGLQADVSPRLLKMADGIGLYRTEVPFQVRSRFPSEEEQRSIYRLPLEAFAPAPVVLRTLDVGSDKQLPYFPIEEENPALGWRGIRVTLDHPETFLTQVRAMLKASEGLNNLRILLPMISKVSELDEAIVLIERARHELLDEGLKLEQPEIGVMIEVPGTIYQISALAKRIDFVSVGTNDLTQYLLAVDRNNARVAKLYDALHPAVLNAMMHLKAAVDGHDIPMSICGEIAGDPLGALIFLGMGVDSLSVSGSNLLRVKWVVRSFSHKKAKKILKQVLTLEEASQVRELLTLELERAGLGGLIRAGKS